mgnify:CR=1 FL=1
MQNSKRTMRNLVFALCIVHCAFFIASCSIPNLESAECVEARDSARQFYSFHFGNEMRPTAENFKARERYLTPRYFAALANYPDNEHDPFTLTKDYPRTFKLAECKAASPDSIDLKIQLYWRDDLKTVQQEVQANFVKQDGKWLLDGVGSKGR